MTATIINLRKARKAKSKMASVQQADENRAKFGEKTAIRKTREADENRKNKLHESGRIEITEITRLE